MRAEPHTPPGPAGSTHASTPAEPWRELYDYWFGSIDPGLPYMQGRLPIWFFGDVAADEHIRTHFVPWLDRVDEAEIERWALSPRGLLSAVLLFDQVPRNAFRGTPEAFAHDARGLALAERLFTAGFDATLEPVELFFAVLPFQHQEDLGMQVRQLAAIKEIVARAPEGHQRFFGVAGDMAERHHLAIERFDRFPHRNVILARESTAAELEFLDDPKNHF